MIPRGAMARHERRAWWCDKLGEAIFVVVVVLIVWRFC
jgi:hypothetical protein